MVQNLEFIGVAIVMNSKRPQHSYDNTFPLFFLKKEETDRGFKSILLNIDFFSSFATNN